MESYYHEPAPNEYMKSEPMWDLLHANPAVMMHKDAFTFDGMSYEVQAPSLQSIDFVDSMLCFDPIPYHQPPSEVIYHNQFVDLDSNTNNYGYYDTTVPFTNVKSESVEMSLVLPGYQQPPATTAPLKSEVKTMAPLPAAHNEVPGKCLREDCSASITYRGFCKTHGGVRRCRVIGCTKGSQGKNLCIAHGGGKRCNIPTCNKSAQSHGLCKAHGGGARCTFDGCGKSSQGNGLCRKHGGGRRCTYENCNNGAQRGLFCAKHGGSRHCKTEDCQRTDRGGGYCEIHRKDIVCLVRGCNRMGLQDEVGGGLCHVHCNHLRGRKSKLFTYKLLSILPFFPCIEDKDVPFESPNTSRGSRRYSRLKPLMCVFLITTVICLVVGGTQIFQGIVCYGCAFKIRTTHECTDTNFDSSRGVPTIEITAVVDAHGSEVSVSVQGGWPHGLTTANFIITFVSLFAVYIIMALDVVYAMLSWSVLAVAFAVLVISDGMTMHSWNQLYCNVSKDRGIAAVFSQLAHPTLNQTLILDKIASTDSAAVVMSCGNGVFSFLVAVLTACAICATISTYSTYARAYGRRSVVALGASLATGLSMLAGPTLSNGSPPTIAIESPESTEISDEAKVTRHYPFVVVGAATAAHAAIEAILQQNPKADILMISEETHLPRLDAQDGEEAASPLSDALMDSYNEWRRYIAPRLEDDHAMSSSVSLVLGKQFMHFDFENKLITLPSNDQISYGRCLIATAGKPRPLYVLDSSKISYTLRDKINTATTFSDFEALDRLSTRRAIDRVTVVGGGFLGTELAVALATDPRNAHLEVQQMFVDCNGPCARHLPPYLSVELTRRLQAYARVAVHTNTLVTSIKPGARGEVHLSVMGEETGAIFTDYAVLASTQIEPNVDCGSFDGLEIDPVHGGIVVNAQLEAVRDLFVAGSVASYYDSFVGRRRVDRYDHAVNSGLLAGQNMVAETKQKVYRHQPMFRSHMPGIHVTCEGIGEIDSRLQTVGVWLAPPQKKHGTESYMRGIVYYLRANKIVGILLWNAPDLLESARDVMVHKPTYDQVTQLTKVISLGPEDWLHTVATDEDHTYAPSRLDLATDRMPVDGATLYNQTTTAASLTPASDGSKDAHSFAAKEKLGMCLEPSCSRYLSYKGLCKEHGYRRMCIIPLCTKTIQGKNKCIAHGGGKPCKTSGCPRTAQSQGLCKTHGGGSRCTIEGCDRSAQSKGRCRRHGGGSQCSVEGCLTMVQRNNKCAKHNGTQRRREAAASASYIERVGSVPMAAVSNWPLSPAGYTPPSLPKRAKTRRKSKPSPPKEITGQCLDSNCTTAVTYRGFCKAHGGSRRCSAAYCPKGQQGGRYCIAHGGGKRCRAPDCIRSAQSRGLCKAHGGGARCKADDCDKSAQSGGYCRTHGGVRLCSVDGCGNGVQRGGKCSKHGDVRLCRVALCGQTDRGGGLCEVHRRNKVCSVDGCKRLLGAVALTFHEDDLHGFCVAHAMTMRELNRKRRARGIVAIAPKDGSQPPAAKAQVAIQSDKKQANKSKVPKSLFNNSANKTKTLALVAPTREEVPGQCFHPNCMTAVRYRGYCKAHGGARFCSFANCPKSRQGGKYCIFHGGGKKCTVSDCVRPVQSRGLCKTHGGGTRCKVFACNKSAQSGGLCRAHGGARKCSFPSCNSGVQRRGMCSKHGTLRRCVVQNCGQADRGGGYCNYHRRPLECLVPDCKKLLAESIPGCEVIEVYCVAHRRHANDTIEKALTDTT
ncbi:apoptosis-inducing factor 1 [Achlya hypogyna]|uniref:Apoptosis-inducing factor 1 n=1 Tax=Achlya hypogyna TaxID=1202772 RepID=A0A1V9ZQ50_ACHHY|nr:apoptosis-inducing factor 1 [Achlya hypogyna]